MEIIRCTKSGGYLASVRCVLDLSQTTVSFIVKEKDMPRNMYETWDMYKDCD